MTGPILTIPRHLWRSSRRSGPRRIHLYVTARLSRTTNREHIEPIQLRSAAVTVERGRTCVLALGNETVWKHPIHLHGHSFRVLCRDAVPVAHRSWQGAVLIGAEETVEIAFVADDPGDWMLHCRILEHRVPRMAAILGIA